MTEQPKEPLSDKTKETPEALPFQFKPLELVDGKVPEEFRKKFYKEVILPLGLIEMDKAVDHLTSEFSKIVTLSDTILRNQEGETDDTQELVERLVRRFNYDLKLQLFAFHRDKKARPEIDELLQ